MSAKKKILIKSHERALLTDTLPYELPIFFHNKNLALLAHLAGQGKCGHQLHAAILLSKDNEFRKGLKATKPYFYSIAKDSGHKRRLALIHPRSQHAMSMFYRDHQQFILNACNRPSFSLRYASRVATHYLDPRYASKLPPHNLQPIGDEDPMGFRAQARWASTYFSYRPYSLSHRFFDSDEFIALERQYAFLLKIDVSRCFESIYTHSIEWAMRGKDFAKHHLPGESKRPTFEALFDEVIRSANWNETHGIVVGPEFSRIFSEVILQSVDRDVLREMGDLKHRIEIRRYVDDFFIFSNDEHAADLAKGLIKRCLEGVNLHLNDAKTVKSTRPFVASQQVVKNRVADRVERLFDFAKPLLTLSGDVPEAHIVDRVTTAALKEIRNTAVEANVGYESFASHALTVLNRQARAAALRIPPTAAQPKDQSARLSFLLALVRISQLLYTTDPRVITSIKLASMYVSVLDLSKRLHCSPPPLQGLLLDGLRGLHSPGTLEAIDEIARINHVCSVDRLVGGRDRIETVDLLSQLGLQLTDASFEKASLFQLLAVLLVARRRHRFERPRELAIKEMKRRITAPEVDFQEDTEAAILLIEFIACPHINAVDKIDTVIHCAKQATDQNYTQVKAQQLIDNSGWISFVDWDSSVDLPSMLARKELTLAYG
jgi:hypothetical protein